MNTRKFSSKQEKYVAKQLGGKVQPNSGATFWLKGDVTLDNWLVECKTQMTSKKSFTIKKEWLEKLEQEKFSMRKQNCVLAFNFGPNEPNFYVVSEKTFKQMQRSSEE